MKYYMGFSMMSFVSGLLLSYVYFSMQNLRAEVAEVSQQQSRSGKMMASVEKNEPRKLKSPKFSDDLPLRLRMWANAELKVEWAPVTGAKGYSVSIESKDGESVRQFKTKSTSLTLHDLPLPQNEDVADYNVRLAALNAADEVGEMSEARPLAVQRERGQRPPTIKSIEVLD